MLNEGDRAPAMTVTASDSSSVDLESPGQPLVLYSSAFLNRVSVILSS